MLRNILETGGAEATSESTVRKSDRSLQKILWLLWTVAVVGTAIFNWYADAAAGRPFNLLGLIIYSALVGSIGLVVMTMIEMWFEPQRFID